MVQFDEEKQKRKVDELLAKEAEDSAQILSQKYGIQYIDLSRVSINTDALRILPESEARDAKVAVFDSTGRKIQIAVLSPGGEKTVSVVKELQERGYIPSLFMVSEGSLSRAWDRYKDVLFASEVKAGVLDISNEEIQKLIKKVQAIADVRSLVEEVLKLKKSYRISRILETILAGALSLEASDIHLEPEEAYVRLRYRLDGVLTDILNFDKETFFLLLSRIKLLSGLKLNVKNAAQDGRFSIKIDADEIEIRTSILPGAYSESIVLRILNPKSIGVPMEELGIDERLFPVIEKEIKKPNGMLLVTGPTGSGKTTTLYAFLKRIHTSEIKIITIEDPIEYHLPGIVQTQTNDKNYTFASGLRSALRQDPDVIMVGEIRDGETAEIAINAGLTGHLVLSTLHTNNAAGAFPRLVDLGVNPKVISSAVNLAMAQRLVRKLCQFCKKEAPLGGKEKEEIEKVLSTLPRGFEPPQKEKTWVSVGCKECSGLGYKGRIGIFEAIIMSEEVDKIIKENPSEREIAMIAKTQGLLTMEQDGVLKVLRGVTTLEELTRVISIID